jgi:hypothetical protein
MGYVIAAVIVLLIVGAGVTFFTMRATRAGRREAAVDRDYGGGTPTSDAAIVAPDDNTPLGDTDQHAGEQTREGETVDQPEAGRGLDPATDPTPGIGGPGEGGVGGEGEGSRPVTPESERLANRDR